MKQVRGLVLTGSLSVGALLSAAVPMLEKAYDKYNDQMERAKQEQQYRDKLEQRIRKMEEQLCRLGWHPPESWSLERNCEQ